MKSATGYAPLPEDETSPVDLEHGKKSPSHTVRGFSDTYPDDDAQEIPENENEGEERLSEWSVSRNSALFNHSTVCLS